MSKPKSPAGVSQSPLAHLDLKARLTHALRQKSNLDQHRPYLGMSGIGGCPRRLYFDFLQGRPEPTDQDHWYSWTGYLHEAGIIHLLDGQVKVEQIEVIAAYDDRFRGHVDGTLDGDLVEIKSVNWGKYRRIINDGPTQANIDQIQMYLRHGGWSRCHLIYIARDVPHVEWCGLPLWTYTVHLSTDRAHHLDRKAKAILAAIDKQQPPTCNCNWCTR